MSKNQLEECKEKTQEIAELGDGEVFIKRHENGFIKAVRGIVLLSEQRGHLLEIQGKVMITAAGYNELNKIPGISIITPNNLTLPDSRTVVNPYPVIDRDSGSISKVWVKKLGVGLSPIGNMVITSSTLLYDIRMYFVQDLMKKVQYNHDAGRICIESMLTEEEKTNGIFQKFEGNMGVWGNVENPDVLKALNTFINNKLFAERKAQTIAERNVLKKHPALSKVYVEAQGPEGARVARVPVIGYTHDLSREELEEIAEAASDAGEGKIKAAGQEAEIVDVGGEIEEEDIRAADEEASPEEAPRDEPTKTNKYKGKGMF